METTTQEEQELYRIGIKGDLQPAPKHVPQLGPKPISKEVFLKRLGFGPIVEEEAKPEVPDDGSKLKEEYEYVYGEVELLGEGYENFHPGQKVRTRIGIKKKYTIVPPPEPPAPPPPPPPSIDEYDAAMEEHLKSEREGRGYTTREPDAYFASSNPRWSQDAKDWIAHRDAVMMYALELMNGVQSGQLQPPTLDEFRLGLPQIVWTYVDQQDEEDEEDTAEEDIQQEVAEEAEAVEVPEEDTSSDAESNDISIENSQAEDSSLDEDTSGN